MGFGLWSGLAMVRVRVRFALVFRLGDIVWVMIEDRVKGLGLALGLGLGLGWVMIEDRVIVYLILEGLDYRL